MEDVPLNYYSVGRAVVEIRTPLNTDEWRQTS